jgi:hypothetical protein
MWTARHVARERRLTTTAQPPAANARRPERNTKFKQLTLFSILFMFTVAGLLAMDQAAAYHKHGHGHVKIKVWRGPSHGYKKHKHAPFGYHFSIEEKGH